MEKKLRVKDLTISFRTTNGRVQAVRRINFDLQKGETLSIVGESGSGKSVTSKAILGILAGNAIVEDGEIVYDGKDLLKISEKEFQKIRGDKIAMIFQDPMSSLNPIVKIGRQLTEAMILKGKARQKESKENFNTYLRELKLAMIAAKAKGDKEKSAEIEKKCSDFDKFEYKHLELESAYRKAHEAATEAVDDIDDLVFEMEKNAAKDASFRLKEIASLANSSIQEYVVKEKAGRLKQLVSELKKDAQNIKKVHGNLTDIITRLRETQGILKEASALEMPDFFAMGYYLTFSGEKLPKMQVTECNTFLRKYLDEHFMSDFIADAKQGLMYSADVSYKAKEEAVVTLKEKLSVFEKEKPDKAECVKTHRLLSEKVEATINKLDLVKDNLTYTFSTALMREIDKYFTPTNNKEEEQIKKNIHRQIIRLIEHYEASLAVRQERDFDSETIEAIDYLKENASGVVNKITKQIAKAKAIKLMEEVGIAEPRKRYNQYPFEFSGGMRQRIVIAIALAADPDILICDEPTTALDVTIQAQILELINKLKEERHLSVIFITHDLGVVANMADRIAVMYAGKVVEYGTATDIFYHAAHPYTWALLSSMPDLDTGDKLEAIPGTPPNMICPPVGDAFAARNKYAMKIDFEKQPPMFQISDTHYAATWLLHPDAPKVEPPKSVTDRIARMQGKRG